MLAGMMVAFEAERREAEVAARVREQERNRAAMAARAAERATRLGLRDWIGALISTRAHLAAGTRPG